jgi:hypothetical protein
MVKLAVSPKVETHIDLDSEEQSSERPDFISSPR